MLSQDGVMRFINTDVCKLLFDIGATGAGLKSVATGFGGRHIVAVTEDGNLQVFSVQALAADLNKVSLLFLNHIYTALFKSNYSLKLTSFDFSLLVLKKLSA